VWRKLATAARASAQRLSSTALRAAASEAASAGVSGLAEPLSACAVSLGAVGGMMPVPSLIGWAAAAGGTAGLGAGVAVDPPLGTRRMPVSGAPLAG
jgi:hypothetical protein